MSKDKARFSTRVILFICRKILFRVKLHNEEVLDEYDSYLICPNHGRVFDPAFVFPKKYDRDVHIIAKKELFRHAWFRWLAKRYNIISIDRDNVDVRSMLESLKVFKEDDKAKLLLFPEGKVIKNPEDIGKVYKKGAAFIASHLDKPIIPVYITRRPKLFQRVNVYYGKPYTITKEDAKGIGKMDSLSKDLLERIYSMRVLEEKK